MALYGSTPQALQAVPYTPDPSTYITLSGRFGTEFQNMLKHNPVALMDTYWQNEYYRTKPTEQGLTPTDLRRKYIGTNIKWEQYTNKDGVVTPELEEAAHRRYLDDQSISNVTASSYQDFASGAVSLAGAFAGSLFDPINAVAALIPFGGTEAVVAKSIATAGAVSAGRVFATRFAQGAVEDAIINGVIQQPIQAQLEKAVGYDYTIQDYLANVAIGAALGGTLRGGLGFLTDPLGRTEVANYMSKLDAQNKAKGTLTATEQRLANMPAEDVNAIAAIKLEQELTGNFEGDIAAILEATDTSHFSTITKQSRDFGIFKEGRISQGKEVLDIDNVKFTPVTKAGKSQRVRGEIQIGDQVFTATSTSKKKVLKDLNRQIAQHSYAKVAFDEKGMQSSRIIVARFAEDNGTLSALRGYGETKVEAMRMLNERYNEFLERPRDFLRSQKDMREMYPTKEEYRATIDTRDTSGVRASVRNEIRDVSKDIELLRRKTKTDINFENVRNTLAKRGESLDSVAEHIEEQRAKMRELSKNKEALVNNRKTLRQEISKLKQEINQKKNVKENQEKLVKNEAALRSTAIKIETRKEQIRQLGERRKELERKKAKLQKEIDELNKQLKKSEDIEFYNRTIANKEATVQELKARLRDMDRRLEIDFLNNSEHWYNDYVDTTRLPKTEAEYTAKLNNALNEKSSYAQEQLAADAEETKLNVDTATNDKSYNTYRDEMYGSLKTKQFVHEETRVLNDEYKVLREDNAKLESESIDEIVTAYYNCTRGL